MGDDREGCTSRRFLAADTVTLASNPASLRAASWALHGELHADVKTRHNS